MSLTTTSTVRLGELVREVLEGKDEFDVHEIVTEVLELIPEDLLREVLEEALVPYVRKFITNDRAHVARSFSGSVVADSPRWQSASKLEKIFAQTEWVGGRYKAYGTLSRAEVQEVAEGQYKRAEDIRRIGDRHSEVASLMKKHRAKQVSDLGEKIFEVYSD